MTPPFVPLAIAWFVGLWLADWLHLPPLVWMIGWLLSILILLGWWRRVAPRPPYTHHSVVMGMVMVVFLMGGASRSAFAQEARDSLQNYNDSGTVTLLGTIERYPERRGDYTIYTLAADGVLPVDATNPIPVTGLVRLNLPPHPAYTYGDQLRLTGRLQTPTRSPNFDYRAYLAIQGIHSTFRASDSTLIDSQQGAPLFQALNNLRAYAEQTVQRMMPEPHASLLNGILLGLNGAIPDAVQEAFNITGTTHVLVISGANFSVLVAVVSNLALRGLGQRRGMVLTLGVIALYALLVGGDPPVLRAALMGSLVLLAWGSRRAPDALNILAAVVVLLTAINPAQRADVGFQLSALATLGLILFVPYLSRATAFLLAKLPLSGTRQRTVLNLLTESLLLTIAAQLITTPLIVGVFGRLSLVSLLTNVLIVPVQPFIMQSGALATLVGMVWLPMGQLLGMLPYAGLAWTLAVVEWTATLPFASVAVGPFPPEHVWAFYGAVGFAIWLSTFPRKPIPASPFDAPSLFGLTRRTLLVWAGLVLVAIVPWWLALQRPDGHLHLYMLDVEQGDALLVVAPDGKQILIDGGESSALLLDEISDIMPFWDRTLEMVVVTHPDQDHLGGLPDLLNRYEVERILESGYRADTDLYQVWQSAVTAEGVVPIVAQSGQQIEMGGGVVLNVLAPRGAPFAEPNLNSVVLELRYQNFCALLTGDIELESEQRLVGDGALSPCPVLKVAHHGSTTSTSVDFLEAVAPAYALVSAGSGNPFGHPAPQVLERLEARGIRLFRTDQQGTIHLWSDGQQLWAESERE